jgi:hypothetical protein
MHDTNLSFAATHLSHASQLASKASIGKVGIKWLMKAAAECRRKTAKPTPYEPLQ